MRDRYAPVMDMHVRRLTFSAFGTAAPTTAASNATREMAAQFEAMLFKEAFAPLSKAMGFYGDSVVSAAAQAMARGAEGLADPLASAMDAAARDGALR